MREFGGAEMSLTALIPYLLPHAQIRFFVENDSYANLLNERFDSQVEVTKSFKGSWLGAIAFNALIITHIIRRWKPDAILANSHKGGVVLALAARFLPKSNIPSILYVRDYSWKYLPFIFSQLPNAHLVAPSMAVWEHPTHPLKLPSDTKTNIIPNIANIEESPLPLDRRNPIIACLCARMVPWKGLQYLIEAFSDVAAKHPTARLHIHGEAVDAAYVSELRTLAQKLKLTERISFFPFSTNVGDVYRHASIIAVPSISDFPGPETFSRPIVEAWGHARPVVAFSCGGPRYLIRDGIDGYLVPEKDSKHLGDSLNLLLTDFQLAERMGKSGYNRVVSEFNAEKVCSQIRALLQI